MTSRQCLDVIVIHDGIHPSIMNRVQAISVSFRIRNTAPVQYHLVLEEAITCQHPGARYILRGRNQAVPVHPQ